MVANQRQLARFARGLDSRYHSPVQRFEVGEGPVFEGRFGHPGSVFEHPTQGGDKALLVLVVECC